VSQPAILKTLRFSRVHKFCVSKSGDEIANVNFIYDDIVHVLRNIIDSRINSAAGSSSPITVFTVEKIQ